MELDAELFGNPQRIVAFRLRTDPSRESRACALDAKSCEEVQTFDVNAFFDYDAGREHRIETPEISATAFLRSAIMRAHLGRCPFNPVRLGPRSLARTPSATPFEAQNHHYEGTEAAQRRHRCAR